MSFSYNFCCAIGTLSHNDILQKTEEIQYSFFQFGSTHFISSEDSLTKSSLLAFLPLTHLYSVCLSHTMFSFSYFQNSVLYGTYIVNVRSHLSTAHNHQSKFQHFKRQGMIKEIVRVVVAQDDGLKEKWESTVQGTYKGQKKMF